ncbi:MAG TPA: DUF2007 domain-containing protein [Bacteroidales bacterium]|nr:DUF2007 domain-containing protein [Bacteroidales bacterium]HSA44190.1 DUF2007 domain-containing protein [Bacteroidales bacterium]
MKTPSPSTDPTPVEVFCGTPWQAGMVKSMLESAGIDAYLQDMIMGTMNPWWTAPGGAGAVRLFVASTDAAEAKSIVEDYENNLRDSEK